MKFYAVLLLLKQALNHAEGEVPAVALLSSWLHYLLTVWPPKNL